MTPSALTPPDVASLQTRLRALQWTIRSLTLVLVALIAQQGELQRPKQIADGLARRAAK